MKRIAIMICIAVCLAVIGLVALRESLKTSYGHDGPGALDGEYADLAFPGYNPDPVERLEQWREVAYDACAGQGVEAFARQLKTKATPEAAAKGYARWAHEPAVYKACLRGFSD